MYMMAWWKYDESQYIRIFCFRSPSQTAEAFFMYPLHVGHLCWTICLLLLWSRQQYKVQYVQKDPANSVNGLSIQALLRS